VYNNSAPSNSKGLSNMVGRYPISKKLEPVINRLVEGLKPERIYLFGSQARGEASSESDFDLLIVIPQSNLPRHQREAKSYDLLWGLTTPVDLVVLTREEFNQTSQVRTSLASNVKDHGRILYNG
jgi:predicted nucleotidyltransferase